METTPQLQEKPMPKTPSASRFFEMGMEFWRRALLGAGQAKDELRKRAETMGGPLRSQEKDRPPRIW